MARLGVVLAVAATTAFAGVAGANFAHAGPPPPCSFTLSPPQVVQVSGVNMVTATVSPMCGPQAVPAQSVACLQMQAGDRVTRCHPSDNSGSANIFYEPYVPGATYVATGRGCAAWIGQLPAPDCQLLGPYSATL
ncbi:hypothetical protein NGTWS1803_34690 [Mycolicibacterium cyprinidarum]|nr:hypothetical protein NGTWS1803_34690 [Mycolicibacterium sp. NGTWS1803]